jgi:hypothetical protein
VVWQGQSAADRQSNLFTRLIVWLGSDLPRLDQIEICLLNSDYELIALDHGSASAHA